RVFTGAIHIYGGDFFGTPRSEWDRETLQEQPYDGERARKLFPPANARGWGRGTGKEAPALLMQLVRPRADGVAPDDRLTDNRRGFSTPASGRRGTCRTESLGSAPWKSAASTSTGISTTT